MSETFVVEFTYRVDTRLQDEYRPLHLAYLEERVRAGQLLVSGPKGADEVPGGVLIYRANDREAARQLVMADPFVENGVVVELSLRSWRPINGPLSAAFAAQ